MKTIFRVLIILVVATLIGGLMYAGVNASSSTNAFPSFEEGRERPQFSEGTEFRPEGDRDGRDERGGFGFPGGVLKAVVLMSIAGGIYSGIVWAGKKAKRAVTT
jgi:hypothetical protein